MLISVKEFKRFDKVTKYRLENAFIFALIVGLTMPVLSNLKGLLSVTVLSLIAIFSKLMMKTNNWFDKKFTLGKIYKMGIILNLMLTLALASYFLNPKIMVFSESVISVIEFGVFSVYSIKLNHYLTKHYQEMFKEFQKVRNSTWADGTLLGLFTTSFLSLFLNMEYIIIIALGFQVVYNTRLFLNWNFYEKKGIADY